MLFRSAKLLIIIGLLLTAYVSASGQVRPLSVPVGPDRASENSQTGSIEEEMRAKQEIRAVDKAHKENLDKARNLAFLGASLYTAFKQKHSLDREDIKKLEKAEKLAKGIREAAGGCDDETEIEKRPADLNSALSMLSETAESLKQKVEKTPKRVVSTAVIDEANVLLELIRIVRTMHPRA
jgi:hypothetical protein